MGIRGGHAERAHPLAPGFAGLRGEVLRRQSSREYFASSSDWHTGKIRRYSTWCGRVGSCNRDAPRSRVILVGSTIGSLCWL
jgi:hypothetical protein